MRSASLALLVASTSLAQTPYQRWVDEDVAYLIAPAERASYESLSSDAERERFIEQFWLRRDPTLNTAANEVKEEHYRRIAYANQRFAGGIAGWKADRGRAYIILGPPDELESHASAAHPTEAWRYRSINGVGPNIVLRFTDPERKGAYPLAAAARTPTDADRALAGLLHLPLERIAHP